MTPCAKVVYASRGRALKALERLQRKSRKYSRAGVYQCAKCGTWHIGRGNAWDREGAWERVRKKETK